MVRFERLNLAWDNLKQLPSRYCRGDETMNWEVACFCQWRLISRTKNMGDNNFLMLIFIRGLLNRSHEKGKIWASYKLFIGKWNSTWIWWSLMIKLNIINLLQFLRIFSFTFLNSLIKFTDKKVNIMVLTPNTK